MHEDQDKAQICELIATWIEATVAGDLEKILGLMTEDVVFLRPGCPPMRGRPAFADASRAMPAALIEGKPDVQEIQIMGNYAYCWNHLSVTVTPAKGEAPVHCTGDILSIFRKDSDGRWRLFRDANMFPGG